MKALLLFTLLLAGLGCVGPTHLADDKQGLRVKPTLGSLKVKRVAIDSYLTTHTNDLIVLVKVPGKNELLLAENENWPDEIEYTYNILKDANGRVILIGRIPYDESGDASIGYKHYFDEQGNVFAVVKDESIFNESVEGGVVREQSVSYYDSDFLLMDKKAQLMNVKFKRITQKANEFDFNEDAFTVYKNVNTCLAGYQIDSKLVGLSR